MLLAVDVAALGGDMGVARPPLRLPPTIELAITNDVFGVRRRWWARSPTRNADAATEGAELLPDRHVAELELAVGVVEDATATDRGGVAGDRRVLDEGTPSAAL